DREPALDAPRDVLVRRVDDLVDLVRGPRLADVLERGVAHVEEPARVVRGAGRRVIPGDLEVVPRDAGVLQRGEDLVVPGAAALDAVVPRRDVVAQRAEPVGRRDRGAVGV